MPVNFPEAATTYAQNCLNSALHRAPAQPLPEFWVGNDDIGDVLPGQEVKVKLAAFQFEQYGMMQGRIAQISADATEASSANTRSDALTGRDRPMGPLSFRALVDLRGQVLEADGQKFKLAPGMQVVAEINLGRRTVLEYLLSPVQKAVNEAGMNHVLLVTTI